MKRGLVALALLAACASATKREVAAVGPRPLSARELLSADLDFVVRADMARLRATPEFPRLAERLPGAGGPAMLRKLRRWVGRASAIEFGGRLFADGFQGDGTLVIEGDGADEAPEAEFRPIASSRPDVRLFERFDFGAPREPAAARAESVLEAHCSGGGIVLASAAEADAVLRIVRDGPDAARLEPPAHGMFSFVGRLPGGDVTARGKDVWRKLARGLQKFGGSVELIDGIEAEVDLDYASADDASEALAVARDLVARLGLAEKPLRALADSVRLSPREATLGLRFKVPVEVLAAVDWARLASPAKDENVGGPAQQ